MFLLGKVLEALGCADVGFALYVGIAIVHFIFRKKFLAISFEPSRAEKEGMSVRGWDFLFYALFGVVVIS